MSLDEAALFDDVRNRLFSASSGDMTIGAELELIPIFSATHRPVRIDETHRPSSVRIVRRIAERKRWTETASESSPPCWDLPDGDRISFEPGGQIEISSPPHSSCSGLIASLQKVARQLAESADADGVELLTFGT